MKKDDGGKLEYQKFVFLPPKAAVEVGKVMEFGAKKYGFYNYVEGNIMSNMRGFGSILRHVFSYMAGEDNDPESGKSHLAHACCQLMIMLEQKLCGVENDERPLKSDNLPGGSLQ